MNYLIIRFKFFLCNFPNHYPAALRTMLPIVSTAMVTDKEKKNRPEGRLSMYAERGIFWCVKRVRLG